MEKIQPGSLPAIVKLNLSDISLGDLLLAKLSASANLDSDVQEKVKRLLTLILDVIEGLDDWAQAEAEARYINFIREGRKVKESVLIDTSAE